MGILDNIKSYVELVAMTDDERTKDLAKIRAEQARAQLALDIMKSAETCAIAATALNESLREHPVSFDRVAECMDTLDLAKRRMRQMVGLKEKLFPAEEGS